MKAILKALAFVGICAMLAAAAQAKAPGIHTRSTTTSSQGSKARDFAVDQGKKLVVSQGVKAGARWGAGAAIGTAAGAAASTAAGIAVGVMWPKTCCQGSDVVPGGRSWGKRPTARPAR